MVHIARVTQPSVASDASKMFDEFRQCFALCAAIKVTNDVWCQAQLGFNYGSLDFIFFLLSCCCCLYCLTDILGLWLC